MSEAALELAEGYDGMRVFRNIAREIYAHFPMSCCSCSPAAINVQYWQVLVVISPLCSVLVRSPLYLLYIKYVLFVLVRATRYAYCASETDLAQCSALSSILHF
jgi:hypothetical protein